MEVRRNSNGGSDGGGDCGYVEEIGFMTRQRGRGSSVSFSVSLNTRDNVMKACMCVT